MKTFRVSIQVIHAYSVDVDAKDEDEAKKKAWDMTTEEIEKDGELTDIESDYVEVIEELED